MVAVVTGMGAAARNRAPRRAAGGGADRTTGPGPRSPATTPAPKAARRRRQHPHAVPTATALLAATLWAAYVAARGFAFSNDSMSYAALARAFDGGHWFTSNILAFGTAPGRFRGEWPPLYPALVAVGHALGLTLPWSEFVLSGLAFTAAAVFGVQASRTAGDGVPWAAVPLLAGFPAALYVAGFGWSEPVCLALLGLHYWLAARAARMAARGRPAPPGLFFAQAFTAGLAFLDRYAAGAFLPAALALPILLGAPGSPARRRGAVAAALGAALPTVPWAAACIAITGRLGAHYLRAGTGLGGALHMTLGGLHQVAGWFLTAGNGASAPGSGPRLVVALCICTGLGVVLPVTARRRRAPAGKPLRPRAVLAGMLVADTLLSTAVVIGWRARYLFDPIDPRLLAPSLYTALLAALVLLSFVPWRPTRELALLPLSAVLLWHGLRWGASAVRNPRVPAALAGPWCTAGAAGDCGMMRWLSQHTTGADLIVGNASFIINFQLGRTTEDVEAYPYNPDPTPRELGRWTTEWTADRPGGRVFLVLDSDTGPVDGSGPVMAAFWSKPGPDLPGVRAALVASGASYRIWRLTPRGLE